MGKAIIIVVILLIAVIASTFFLLGNSDNQTNIISPQIDTSQELIGKWESTEGYLINLETNEFEQISYEGSRLEMEIYPGNEICTAKVLNSGECQYPIATYQSRKDIIYVYQLDSPNTIIYKVIYQINGNQLEWLRQDKNPETNEWADTSRNIFTKV